MLSSQLVLMLAGAAVSVSAQSSAPAKATLWKFEEFPVISDSQTVTLVASNSAATTYSVNCPAITGSAASSIKAAASSFASNANSAASSVRSDAGSIASSLDSRLSSAASAGFSGASSFGGALVSGASSRAASLGGALASATSSIANIGLTPIPRPTNARRDNLRLLPIAPPKPTGLARRQDEGFPNGVVGCVPWTVVQGPETFGLKAEMTEPIAFKATIDMKWKGDVKTADVTGGMSMSVAGLGDMLPMTTETVKGSEIFTTTGVYAVAAPTSSGAPKSNPAAAGPLPNGAAAYVGAAAGIFGAMLAL